MKALKITLLVLVTLIIIDKILYFGILSIDKKVLSGNGIGKINHFFKNSFT